MDKSGNLDPDQERPVLSKACSAAGPSRKAEALRDVGISVILLFGLIYIEPFINSALIKFFKSTSPLFIGYQIIIIKFFLVSIFFLLRYGGLGKSDFIFKKRDILVVAVGLFVVLVIIELSGEVQKYQSSQYIKEINSLNDIQLSILFVELVLVGPFLEELLYRKFYLEIFRSKWPIIVAVLLTAIIETLLHFGYSISQLLYILFGSIFSSIIYLNSQLGSAYIIHSFYNFIIYCQHFG